MLRAIVSFLVNLSLVVGGIVAAYFLERAVYGLSGKQWQVNVSSAGIAWMGLILCLLWVVALSSGFYLANETRGMSNAGVQDGEKWYLRVWHEARSRAELPLFWSRSSLVFISVALFTFGVRGLFLQGQVPMEPSHVVFLNPPQTLLPTTASITVFFENDSAKIEAPYQKLLRRFARMDVACGISEIEIAGNASSAPFARGSRTNNPDLANRRMAAVEHEIKLVMGDTVKFSETSWVEEQSMFAKHWILDTRASDRVREAEPFNRRVDLLVKTKNRCDPSGEDGRPAVLRSATN